MPPAAPMIDAPLPAALHASPVAAAAVRPRAVRLVASTPRPTAPEGLARYARPLAEGRCPPGLQGALQRLAYDARRRGLGPVAGLAAALEDAVAALLARPATPALQRQVAVGVALAERMREALRDGVPLGALVITAADHIAALEQAGVARPGIAAGPPTPRIPTPWSRRGSASSR